MEERRSIRFLAGETRLEGDLTVPAEADAIVLFAHGSGSSRHSPRNRQVADTLVEARLATLLIDLLSEEEERVDHITGELRFDIAFLTERLLAATDWLGADQRLAPLRLGYFGASTGAAAALVAAAARPDRIGAVVSRGGRPDLAGHDLPRVRAPTLLIVGGDDAEVLQLNREAMEQFGGENELEIIPGATHLFEEPGALEQVARFAQEWFARHLAQEPSEPRSEIPRLGANS